MSRTHCPDCNEPLKPFKLVDATQLTWGEGTHRVNLNYAPQDEDMELGGLFGGINPTGDVYARLCTQCGRILLYAVPMEEKD